jgi:RNA polymerase sigma factor (sigma-70 family)
MNADSALYPQPHAHVHALYRGHHGWLLGWLRGRLGNSFDAADLAQDTFLRILTAPDHTPEKQGDWQLREPRAYLTVVAKRLIANLYRRRSLEQAYLDALGAMPEPLAPSPEQQAIILETLQEIDAMLDGLAPSVRQAFLMAQLEGLGYAEIAARLGVSERTVKRYMAEAMAHCILLAV